MMILSNNSVRRANSSDFKAIIEIGTEIHGAIENRAQFNWPADFLAQELEKTQTLIVESEAKIVSFLCYRDLVDVYEISVLATRFSAQKKKFQETLIQSLQVLAAKQRRSVILEVHKENVKAVALYQKMGFILLHTRKQYYPDKADALVMSWGDNKAGC